jgi:hypothetical protein
MHRVHQKVLRIITSSSLNRIASYGQGGAGVKPPAKLGPALRAEVFGGSIVQDANGTREWIVNGIDHLIR